MAPTKATHPIRYNAQASIAELLMSAAVRPRKTRPLKKISSHAICHHAKEYRLIRCTYQPSRRVTLWMGSLHPEQIAKAEVPAVQAGISKRGSSRRNGAKAASA